jgi:hypothetical protein
MIVTNRLLSVAKPVFKGDNKNAEHIGVLWNLSEFILNLGNPSRTELKISHSRSIYGKTQ